jgi:predicted MFS family arabinose efflux permease
VIPSLLRENRSFRTFFLGQSVSLLGDQVTLIALPLVGVIVLDASPAQMGYLATATLLPNLLFSLHAGAWVDRRGRRRETMIVADVCRAVLLLSIPIAYWLDLLTFAQLYVVGFLTGLASVFFFVSYSILFVSLVPRERYVEASSLLNGTRAASFVAGVSLGGLLVQILTAPVALVADSASFVYSALALSRIKPVEPPPEAAEQGHLVAGLRYVFGSPTMRAGLGATATINFFNFVFFALFVLYATRYLDVHPGLLGIVLGAGAVGGLIGAVLTGRIVRRIGVGPAFLIGCIAFPAPLLLVPLAGGGHARWVVLACLFLAEFGSGFGVMMLDISFGVITAALVPDRLRARVSGSYNVVNYGVRPVGAFLGGVLGSAIGVRETLWIAAVGAIAGFVWLLPSPIPALKELPDADL